MELDQFFEPVLQALVNGSPIMHAELERQAGRIIAKTRDNLGVPYLRGELNPPPGPPRRRTGDLQQMLETTRVADPELSVEIVATATHFGHPYPRTLLDQGYIFISETDIENLSEVKD